MIEAPVPRRRNGRTAAFVLTGAFVVAAAALAVVAVRGPAGPQTLQDRVRAVGSALRCPVCQDLSVADSPSALAGQMRATITGELRAGRTPAQIKAQFVAAYGDWILLSPPRRGIDLVVWFIPAVLLGAGAVAAVVAVRRWTVGGSGSGGTSPSGPAATELSPQDRSLLDRALSESGEDPA